jgi:hypothetical protein
MDINKTIICKLTIYPCYLLIKIPRIAYLTVFYIINGLFYGYMLSFSPSSSFNYSAPLRQEKIALLRKHFLPDP